jgi:hypothetical protein
MYCIRLVVLPDPPNAFFGGYGGGRLRRKEQLQDHQHCTRGRGLVTYQLRSLLVRFSFTQPIGTVQPAD